jgi:hypothetical protein
MSRLFRRVVTSFPQLGVGYFSPLDDGITMKSIRIVSKETCVMLPPHNAIGDHWRVRQKKRRGLGGAAARCKQNDPRPKKNSDGIEYSSSHAFPATALACQPPKPPPPILPHAGTALFNAFPSVPRRKSAELQPNSAQFPPKRIVLADTQTPPHQSLVYTLTLSETPTTKFLPQLQFEARQTGKIQIHFCEARQNPSLTNSPSPNSPIPTSRSSPASHAPRSPSP